MTLAERQSEDPQMYAAQALPVPKMPPLPPLGWKADADVPVDALAAAGTPVAVQRDHLVFAEGDMADALYVVRSGMIRTYKLLEDGRRQIVGFHEPGDLLGLGLKPVYAYSAEAVLPSRLQRVTRGQVDALLESRPSLRQHLLAVVTGELTVAQEQLLLLGRQTAQEKLLSFLTHRARCARRRGGAPDLAHLPMPRADIADYLGLTIETVSRTLTQLKGAGIIHLLDANRVRLMAV